MNDSAEEKISYQKTLSALFASFSMLAFGALSLLNNFSMDYYSILFMLSIVIPASLSMGFIGFVIGKIFDDGENFSPNPFKKKDKPKTPAIDNAYKIQSMFAPDASLEDEGMQSMYEVNDEIGENENEQES